MIYKELHQLLFLSLPSSLTLKVLTDTLISEIVKSNGLIALSEY